MIPRLGIALLALGAALLEAPGHALASRDEPDVRLVEPDRGERRFVAPATIAIEAKAQAARGRRISRVEFFADGKPIGQASAAPYEIEWRNVALGRYTVRAKATDNRGASDWSSPIKVHVHRNHEPDVTLVEPDRGDRFNAPARIRFEARARDKDQNLVRVEFYANGQLVGQATRAPWRLTWNAVQPGEYLLHAEAIDAHGASDESRKVPIRVSGDAPPTVSLTSPGDGTTFTARATIPLAANASDPTGAGGGGVVRVEFYAGDSLIATDFDQPYAGSWSGAAPGSYTLRARAIDTAGAETFSAPVSITVTPGEPQGYYIHVDHLKTPRLIADAAGTVLWRWDQQEPFGANPPDENPSGLGSFEFPLRFPGQYADKETNLFYNYFRSYNPASGRYIESDPIGLRGGLNTYAYVGGSPMVHGDPLGLEAHGMWIGGTPRLSSASLGNVGLAWISPEWSWWGYIYVAQVSGTLRGNVQASVKCIDEELCLEWEMHRDYPLAVDGSVLLGPNVYASVVGLSGGPKAALGANAVLLLAKTGFELYGLYNRYGVAGTMLVSALLEHGPDQACRAGFPNLTGAPYWP